MKHNNVNLSLLSDSNIDGNVLNIKIRVLVFLYLKYTKRRQIQVVIIFLDDNLNASLENFQGYILICFCFFCLFQCVV